jgi:3',5'-cyclic AMP phosphodiesterase CpdA
MRYLAHCGEDCWSHDLGRWRLIGLNDLLFASDLEAERHQFDWLKERLAEASGRPVALFMHKPLCLDVLDEGRHHAVGRDPSRTSTAPLCDRG